MYKTKTSFVYGFHGIDKEAAYQILNNKAKFLPSRNKYDWLGSGILGKITFREPNSMLFKIQKERIARSKRLLY